MANVTALELTEQFRPIFEDAWSIEYQRTRSSAEGCVSMVPIKGEYYEVPLLPKTNALRKLTQRFEETAPEDFTTGKRRVTTTPYVCPIIFDRKDQMKFDSMNSPIGPTISNQRAEAARQMDKTIVGTATEVGGLIGKAIEVDATGTVTYPSFDSTYEVAVDFAFGGGGSNSGMSYDKLIYLKQQLAKYSVRSQDDTTNNPAGLCLLLGYNQVTDLLRDPKIYNRDNATALLEQVMGGEIHDVQGFTIKAVDDDVLPVSGGVRTCVAFAKNAAIMGYNEMPNHELDVLPTKTHAIQSTFYFDWGLGRIWDQAVWKVYCDES